MSKVLYIEDESGEFVSADGCKRWTCLTKQELYNFLKTKRGRTISFGDSDEKGNRIGVEVNDAKIKEKLTKEKNHRHYLKRMRDKAGYVTDSFDYIEMKDGNGSGEDLIADEAPECWEEAARQHDLKILRKALQSLTGEEMLIINKLYLSPKPLTTRELSKELGVSKTVVIRRSKKIFQKIKNFFDLGVSKSQISQQ